MSTPVFTSPISGKQTFLRAARSEWIKIWSLRSTWITSSIAVLITVLFGAGLTIWSANSDDFGPNAPSTALPSGTVFSMIVVAVLAAMAITGEYSSGQIRSSLAAVPGRLRLATAKAFVVAVVSFIIGAFSIFLSWALSAPFIGSDRMSVFNPNIFGLIWGTGLACAIIAMLSLGLGFLLRSTAGSITIVTILLFVINLPLGIASAFWDWPKKIMGFMPDTVFYAIADPKSFTIQWGGDPQMTNYFLEHWQAALVFCAWGIIPLLLGMIIFSRRDA